MYSTVPTFKIHRAFIKFVSISTIVLWGLINTIKVVRNSLFEKLIVSIAIFSTMMISFFICVPSFVGTLAVLSLAVFEM